MSKRSEYDWFRIIHDTSLSLSRISAAISIPKATVVNWISGAEPSHCDGERLIKLWTETTGKSRDELPKINKGSWGSYHFNEKVYK